MSNLILNAKERNREDKILPSISVGDISGKYLCTLWADGQITFNAASEYFIEDLEQYIKLGKQFYTLFNNLSEKDGIIKLLEQDLKQLEAELTYTLNPVNQRQ